MHPSKQPAISVANITNTREYLIIMWAKSMEESWPVGEHQKSGWNQLSLSTLLKQLMTPPAKHPPVEVKSLWKKKANRQEEEGPQVLNQWWQWWWWTCCDWWTCCNQRVTSEEEVKERPVTTQRPQKWQETKFASMPTRTRAWRTLQVTMYTFKASKEGQFRVAAETTKVL